MTQHLYCRLYVLLLSVTLAFTTSGCWWLRQEARTPERPVSKLASRGISTLGVVPFGDATLQHVGKHVSDVFRTTMVSAIGKEWVRQQDLIEPPGGPKPVGFIGITRRAILRQRDQVSW